MRKLMKINQMLLRPYSHLLGVSMFMANSVTCVRSTACIQKTTPNRKVIKIYYNYGSIKLHVLHGSCSSHYRTQGKLREGD